MRVLSAVRAPLMQVQMHSFDNGSALNKKLDNWDQIVKFCDRKQISIPHSLIDEAALCTRPAVAPARIQSSGTAVCVRGAVAGGALQGWRGAPAAPDHLHVADEPACCEGDQTAGTCPSEHRCNVPANPERTSNPTRWAAARNAHCLTGKRPKSAIPPATD